MLKNIEACQKIAEIVKTSLGPNGMIFILMKSNISNRNEENGC